MDQPLLPAAELMALYRNDTAPWAVLLLAHLPPAPLTGLAAAETAPFERLQQALADWWPQRRRPLEDIYCDELVACWKAYEAIPEAQEGLMQAAQQRLTAAYLQLRVLQRFERRLHAAAPALPNDLRTVSSDEFVGCVEAALRRLPEPPVSQLLAWSRALAAEPAADWNEARHGIARLLPAAPAGA
ncbi:MAG: hypothetical protein ABMA64_10165 [Myxococcota bacterium]